MAYHQNQPGSGGQNHKARSFFGQALKHFALLAAGGVLAAGIVAALWMLGAPQWSAAAAAATAAIVLGLAAFASSKALAHTLELLTRTAAQKIVRALNEHTPPPPSEFPVLELVPLGETLAKAGLFVPRSQAPVAAKAAPKTASVPAIPHPQQPATTDLWAVQQVLNSVCDSVLLLQEDLSIFWANRKTAQILHGHRKDLIGQHIMILAPDEPALRELISHLTSATEGEPQFFEWTCRRGSPGEATFPCEVYAEKVNLPDREILCVSLRDISEAKERTENLQRAYEQVRKAKIAAEEATRAKSLFLARMSHEIRTPMNAILGASHLASRRAQTPEDAREFQRIYTSAQRLLRILNDILDFSKLESGKMPLDPQPFLLHELVASLTEMIEPRRQHKPVEFVAELDSHLAPCYRGDALRIHQVLLNLVENAVKFTDHGRVTLRIRPEKTPGWLLFEVEDEGVGMSPEQLSRLFRTFEQADASIARKYGGTGLGLSICQKLVELMGGQIGVRSQLGQGSTFWFRIPLPEVPEGIPAASVAAPRAHRMQLAGMRILVVDDNDINREITCGLLEEFGCDALAVAGGKEALQTLESQEFDLALLDLEMPEMDGFELAKRLRTSPNERLRNLPLVALTAHVLGPTRQAAAAAGFVGYLTKPVDVALLETELLRVLSEGGKARMTPQQIEPSPAQRDTFVAPVTPAEPAQPTPDSLPERPFLDIERALRLLGGNQNLLEFMAWRFIESWSNFRRQFENAADAEQARRMAHTIKGLAASLGCAEVAEQAASAEAALSRQTGSFSPADYEAFISSVERLEAALQQEFGKPILIE